jgi:hypothetical protein
VSLPYTHRHRYRHRHRSAAIMDEEGVASAGMILPPPPPLPEEVQSWQAFLLEKLAERKQHIVHFVVCEGHDQAVKDFVRHATESKVCLEVPDRFCKTSTSLMKWTDKHSKTGAYILHAPSGKGYRAGEVYKYMTVIKNRCVWDCETKEYAPDFPAIVAFAQEIPNFDTAEGRWFLWRISDDGQRLVPVHDNWRERREEYWRNKYEKQAQGALKRLQKSLDSMFKPACRGRRRRRRAAS